MVVSTRSEVNVHKLLTCWVMKLGTTLIFASLFWSFSLSIEVHYIYMCIMQIWEGIDTPSEKSVQWRISPCHAYSGSFCSYFFQVHSLKLSVSLTQFWNFRFKSLNWILNRKFNQSLKICCLLNKDVFCPVYYSLLLILEWSYTGDFWKWIRFLGQML